MEEIKDIKIGETYNMRVKVLSVDTEDNKGTGVATIPVDKNGKELDDEWAYYGLDIVSAFSPITPENGTKNAENAPKYDPCREFKVGDMVRVRKIHGNLPQCRYNGKVEIKEGDCCSIHEKEHRNLYWITTPSGDNWCFDIAYFELVTPVEELEAFYVCENTESKSFEVRRKEDHKVQAAFYYFNEDDTRAKREEAKATLEHCDRLNAEHRKEQK